jgi:hypothetical protein
VIGVTRAVLVASTLCASGCSFALIESVPDEGYARGAQVTCTREYGLPVADTVLTAVGAGSAVGAFAGEPSDDGVSKTPYTLLGVATVIAAVPFLLSAVYGYLEVADCSAAAAAGNVAVAPSGTPERNTVPGR